MSENLPNPYNSYFKKVVQIDCGPKSWQKLPKHLKPITLGENTSPIQLSTGQLPYRLLLTNWFLGGGLLSPSGFRFGFRCSSHINSCNYLYVCEYLYGYSECL